MLAAENKTRYTVEDYMLLEEGVPFQLINYDLVISPSPTLLHQTVLQELSFNISNHLKQTNNNGLVVFAPIDVKFDEGNVFQPDLIFISAENRKKIINGRIDFAPDLCIEILSPSTAYYDIKHKKRTYENYGVKEYVIIDPLDVSAEVYRLTDRLFKSEEMVYTDGNLILQTITEFSVPIEKLFL